MASSHSKTEPIHHQPTKPITTTVSITHHHKPQHSIKSQPIPKPRPETKSSFHQPHRSLPKQPKTINLQNRKPKHPSRCQSPPSIAYSLSKTGKEEKKQSSAVAAVLNQPEPVHLIPRRRLLSLVCWKR
jgi:hypothetical protein